MSFNILCFVTVTTNHINFSHISPIIKNGKFITISNYWEHDLGRSLRHLIGLVNQLMEKGVDLKSLQDPVNTTHAQGRLVFNLFAPLAEFERDLIVERTPAGLASARARGRSGGRPQGLNAVAKKKAIAAEDLYIQGELSVNEIAENLGISKVTLYQYLRYRGVQIGCKNTHP
nr:recombinase family protein [Xenorhabdus sp. BG5]